MALVELRKAFDFDSAHYLPRLPKEHKCHHMHGHSFRVIVILRGECDPELGWLVDYREINRVVEPLIELLDHRCLNDIAGLENPTSENLAIYVYAKLKPTISHLHQIIVCETCTTECRYPVY